MSENIVPGKDGPVAVHPSTRFERKDINLRPILLTGVGLLVMAVIVHLVGWWVFDVLQASDRATKVSPFPLAVEERGRLPKEPHLEQIDRTQKAGGRKPVGTLYHEEQQRLETDGWVDEKNQVAHIRIDRAMKLLIEQKRLQARPEVKKADQ